MANQKYIAMVGTRHDTMGGIASVVNVYRSSDLFQRRHVRYFASHADGSVIAKLRIGATSWLSFMGDLLLRRLALVHAHVSSRASFWRKSLFLLPAIWLGLPTILHLHGSEFRIFFEDECSNMQRRWVKYVFDNCSQIIVLSRDWQQWVSEMTTNPRVDVVFNPVVVSPLDEQPGNETTPAILCLGRLGRRKGSYDLLEAAAKLRGRGLDFRLRLGGDGETESVRHRAHELGIAEQVDILGWVVGAAKEAELMRASVFALPSYNEGLPMAILEAMAAGLPIVSTPIGGIPDAVRDGVDGYLVRPGDVDALAARLSALIEDPVLRRCTGLAARQRVLRDFAVEAVLPKLDRIYDDLLARHGPPPALRAERRA